MKYMTFNSSCSYAGLANLLSIYGIDTEDRQIALEMGLPFLFDIEDGCYCSGPMLQGKKWFDLYLKSHGFEWIEREINRDSLGNELRGVKAAMIGIKVNESSKHAVIFTRMDGDRFSLLNNKWKHSEEPDFFLLSDDDLRRRVDETVIVGTLSSFPCKEGKRGALYANSISVLHSLKKDISSFCSAEKNVQELRLSMNTLFRAILLDGITMLDLLGEQELYQRLKVIQGQYMTALKEGRALKLEQTIDLPALLSAIDEYAGLSGLLGDSPFTPAF